MVDSVMEAQVNLSEAGIDVEIEEAVADKGYHATDTLELGRLAGHSHVHSRAEAEGEAELAATCRRRSVGPCSTIGVACGARGASGCNVCEANGWNGAFAHVCDTGGARRSWLCGIEKVQKRYLIAAVARNLGLVMRKVFGIGTPRGLQAEGGLVSLVLFAWIHIHASAASLVSAPSRPLVIVPASCATAA